MQKFMVLGILLFLSNCLTAQLPVELKNKYFPKGRRNIVYKTLITHDNAYLAVGELESTKGGFDQDLAVLKINKKGKKEWQLIYDNRLDWACGFDAQEFKNGDLIILGEVYTRNKNEFILFKLTSDGEIIWQKKHALPIKNTFRKVLVSSSSSIIVIGKERSNNDYYFLILNQDGYFIHDFYLSEKTLHYFISKNLISPFSNLK